MAAPQRGQSHRDFVSPGRTQPQDTFPPALRDAEGRAGDPSPHPVLFPCSGSTRSGRAGSFQSRSRFPPPNYDQLRSTNGSGPGPSTEAAAGSVPHNILLTWLPRGNSGGEGALPSCSSAQKPQRGLWPLLLPPLAPLSSVLKEKVAREEWPFSLWLILEILARRGPRGAGGLDNLPH